MAQEIEQYLMLKFRNGLDGKDKSISKIPRDKLYYLNNVFTECQMLTKKHGFNSPEELLTINRIRRELNKIKRELKATKVQPNNGVSSSQDTQISRWTTRVVDDSKVYGFDDNVVSMEKLLLEKESHDRFKAVGIVGREGIGKTTLCQLIFNKPEVKNNFLPRIWVCMARHPDDDDDPKLAIVKRMLVQLGVEKKMVNFIFYEKRGLEGLLCALHLQLVGKRYLIVLDDARETDTWYRKLDSCLTSDKKWDDGFAFGLPKGNGGRVIVTSRNEELAKMMVGEENIHRLSPLSDPESCWKIFKDAVENDLILSNPPNLEDLKLEINQKCGGLPLAAKMMGQAMREQLPK
ncbi:hypothetical protein CerSpe_245440 [Prunus speciosa]